MHRAIFLILVLLVTQFQKGIAQNYDKYYFLHTGERVNSVDSLGQKQGTWVFYELKTLKNCKDTFIIKYAQGKFVDNKKIGEWYYGPQEYGCNEFDAQGYGWDVLEKYENLTSEIYYENGDKEIKFGHCGYFINKDSSYFKGYHNDSKFVNGKCLECEKQKNDSVIICKSFVITGRIRYTKQYTNLNKVIEFILMGNCDISYLH
jgi:hypothetical protein